MLKRMRKHQGWFPIPLLKTVFRQKRLAFHTRRKIRKTGSSSRKKARAQEECQVTQEANGPIENDNELCKCYHHDKRKQPKDISTLFLTYFRTFIDGMGAKQSVKVGHLQIFLPFLCVFNLL